MHIANKTAILVVRDYIKRLEEHPVEWTYWRSSEFARWSYTKTTAHEVLELLKKNPETPPLMTIEEYRDKLDDCACLNVARSSMYSASYDAADDIIDELIKAYY